MGKLVCPWCYNLIAYRPLAREQIMLFDPTLDGVIAEGDPVRLFDEVLHEVIRPRNCRRN